VTLIIAGRDRPRGVATALAYSSAAVCWSAFPGEYVPPDAGNARGWAVGQGGVAGQAFDRPG
jgi:hypothetical protein